MIEIDDVSVRAGDVELLPPTSARVGPGEALVVRGENGAGKSTLLKVLAGRLAPTSGAVRLHGAPVHQGDPTFRRRVASLVGLPPTAPDLTVHDHVLLVARTWWADAPAAADAARDVLAELGLEALRLRYPHELSSGQAQLLALALVLVRPSEVLLLDEPEQRLDAGRLDLVAGALERRRARGAMLVVATHSDVLATGLGDRLLVLGAPR